MARSVPVLLVLAALAVAGCGKSQEEKRKEQVQSICNGLVPGTTTYAEAVQALEGGQFGNQPTACASDFVPGGNDVCGTGVAVCKVDFEFFLNDIGACPSSPAGPECWYYCELRFALSDMTQTSSGAVGPPNQNAVCCARDFIVSPIQAF